MRHPLQSFASPGRRVVAGCLFVLSAGSGAATAQDFSVGLAAGVDRGRVDCVASFACDRASTHWRLTGGWRLGDAVELQIIGFDAGRFQGGDTTPLGTEFGGTFKVAGVGIGVSYGWRFAPGWSLAGRVGAATVRTRFDYQNAAYGSVSKTTLQPLAGIGVAYAITPALRIGIDDDITRFKVHTRRGVLHMLGVAAQYSF